jgi:hypothetical protein
MVRHRQAAIPARSGAFSTPARNVPVGLFASLAPEPGVDTYVIGGVDDPDALRWFASEVSRAVREPVAASG